VTTPRAVLVEVPDPERGPDEGPHAEGPHGAHFVAERELLLCGSGPVTARGARRGTVERRLTIRQGAALVRVTAADYDGHSVTRDLPATRPLTDLLAVLFGRLDRPTALKALLLPVLVALTPVG
jgi:hypothetical protein